jgi:hypothetical protein
MLELRCNKYSSYKQRTIPPLIKEEVKPTCLGEDKNLCHDLDELKPGMTVLARASNNLFN